MTPPKRRKRRNQEGGVHWRESRQRWVASYTFHPGTPQQRKVTKLFKNERDAVRHVADLRRQAEQGSMPEDNSITVGQWLDYWLTIVNSSERVETTMTSYDGTVRLHLKPSLGHIKLAQLQPRHVHEFLLRKRDAMYAQSSLKTFRTVANLALDQAVLEGKVHRNVSRLVPLPKAIKPTKKVRPWTADEANRFLKAARSDRLFAAYVLLVMVGLRKGEVLALQWDEFDEESQTLFVQWQVQRSKKTRRLEVVPVKSDSSKRVIHLPAQAVAALVVHRKQQAELAQRAGRRWRPNNLMFTTMIGTHIDPRNFNDFLDDVCTKAGIVATADQSRSPHTLRHTAATVARALGVDWKDIQVMLGHASIKITMDIYVDAVPEMQRASAELINRGYLLPEDPPDDQLATKLATTAHETVSDQTLEDDPEAENA